MDPQLRQLLQEGESDRELEVILKLRDAASVPNGVRVVAQFGDVVTARIAREEVRRVWEDARVLSVKATRLVLPGESELAETPTRRRRLGTPRDSFVDPRSVPKGATGRGIIVAVLDWGLDITHPNFRNEDGTTRVRALWHQGASGESGAQPYGYGRVFTREQINAALQTEHPFHTLGFHPSQSDPGDRIGTHGTHVTDIAAGNGRAHGSVPGMAPDAEIVFVHLATESLEPLATLGDTVRILEALDFVRRTAGATPWVANLSLGRHGGPHNGRTLVEQGIDQLLVEAPGRAVVQSCGNYFSSKACSAGIVRPGAQRTLSWHTNRADRTPNEIEIWYSGQDSFSLHIEAPGKAGSWKLELGSDAPLVVGDRRVGHAYHRALDPAAGDHHIDIFLERGAPPGDWLITLSAIDVVDGRFHAWVERDAACHDCQSELGARDIVRRYTTGTICNGLRTIAVGAYDARSPLRRLAPFSSSGPTRDGRTKPDLVAPGVDIRAARSVTQAGNSPLLTDKSGTSMAAPHVTGTLACMFEAAPRPLTIYETRNALLGSTDASRAFGADVHRVGSGYLNASRAVAASRSFTLAAEDHPMESSLICERCGAEHSGESTCAECARTGEAAETQSECLIEGCECAGEGHRDFSTPRPTGPSYDEFASSAYIQTESDDSESDDEKFVEAEREPGVDPTDVELHDGSDDGGESLLEFAEAWAHDERFGASAESDDSESRGARFAWLRGGQRLAKFAQQILLDGAGSGFIVIARPGAVLQQVQRGDVLVRWAPGEPRLASAAVIADPMLAVPTTARSLGWSFERSGDGLYAIVIERGQRTHCRHDRFARRIVDRRGRLAPGQFLMRAMSAESLAEFARESYDFSAETVPAVNLRIQNRLIRYETIPSCTVSIAGTSVTATSSSSGVASINLTGVADGTYTLTVQPPNALASGARVGPAVGNVAATPNRGWRPFSAEIVVRSERIASTTSPDLQITGGLVAKIQPVWMRSPSQSARSGETVTHIVVHHTAGPVIGPAINTFIEESERRSAHYVIDTDGQIVKMVHEDNASWHAGGGQWGGRESVNAFSVGIEIVNRSGAYPAAQYAALIQLLQDIRAAYPGIAAHHIVGHSDIATTRDAPRRLGRKSGDPGVAFEWEQLERAGLGIIRPAGPATIGFGGYFTLRPTGRLREGDRDSTRTYGGRVEATLPNTLIAELQNNLRCIGYFCPNNGQFDRVTASALKMFQEHFCSGTRTRPAREGQVDTITAEALAAVVSRLSCDARTPARATPITTPTAPSREDWGHDRENAGRHAVQLTGWADRHGHEYAEFGSNHSEHDSNAEFASDEHRSLGDSVQQTLNAWAKAGLIEGGVMVRPLRQAGGSQRPSQWPMVLPSATNRGNPYATYNVDDYQWHYIVPDPVYSDPQNRVRWTTASLRSALDSGEAAILTFGQIVFVAGDLAHSFDDLHAGRAYRSPQNLMQAVNAGNVLARQVLITLLDVPDGWFVIDDDISNLRDLQRARAGGVTSRQQDGRLAHVLTAFNQVYATPFGALQLIALMLDQPSRPIPRWTDLEQRLPVLGAWRARQSQELQGKLLEQRIPMSALEVLLTNGHYLQYALKNIPHFAPWNRDAFEADFRVALQNTRNRVISTGQAAVSGRPIHASDIVRAAYACHFLTDSFSAGHMRVPRQRLGDDGYLAAKVQHDFDGRFGLVVRNGFDEKWRAYGDGHLARFDDAVTHLHAGFRDAAASDPHYKTNLYANQDQAARAVRTALALLHYTAQAAAQEPAASQQLKAVLQSVRQSGGLVGDGDLRLDRAILGTANQWFTRSIDDAMNHMRKHFPLVEPVGHSWLTNHAPLFDLNARLNTDYRRDVAFHGLSAEVKLRWPRTPGRRVADIDLTMGLGNLYPLARISQGVRIPGVPIERVLLEMMGLQRGAPGTELPET